MKINPLYANSLTDDYVVGSKREALARCYNAPPASPHTMDLKLEIVEDGSCWDDLLLSLPAPHLLQSRTWGELKGHFGWRARRSSWRDGMGSVVAAGQLLTRARRNGALLTNLLALSNTGTPDQLLDLNLRERIPDRIENDPILSIGLRLPTESGIVDRYFRILKRLPSPRRYLTVRPTRVSS